MISMIAFWPYDWALEWAQEIQILTVYSKQVQAAIKNINVNMGIFCSGDLFFFVTAGY